MDISKSMKLSYILLEMYQQNLSKYGRGKNNEDAIKQLINEVTKWNIKSLNLGNTISFKPKENNNFEVRLILDKENNVWELKFGNLNATTDDERFKWEKNDPYRMQKSIFLNNIFQEEIPKLLDNNTIEKIQFNPYDGDGLGEMRLEMFEDIVNKINKINKNNKTHYKMTQNGDNYIIEKI